MKHLLFFFGFGAALFLIVARAYTGPFGDNLGIADLMYCFTDLPFDIGEEWSNWLSFVQSGTDLLSAVVGSFKSSNNILTILKNFFTSIYNLITFPFNFLQGIVSFLVKVFVDFLTIFSRFAWFFFGLSSSPFVL